MYHGTMPGSFKRNGLALAAAVLAGRMPAAAVRSRSFDTMTYDNAGSPYASDARGNMRGRAFDHAYRSHDGKTYDSTGAFLVGELERLDPTMNMPLAVVSWDRDVQLRKDVTIADEISSFTLSSFGSPGGLGAGNSIGNGKAWVGKTTDQISSVSVDISKTPQPLRPWALELFFDIFELESAAKLGRPIDTQKFEAIQLKHQMDIDEQVYIGDIPLGDTGLLNGSKVTNINNVVAGAAGFTQWSQKTPDEILTDFNTALTSVWQASAYAVIPDKVLLPPSQFGYICTQKVSQAGNVSILKYVLENNLLTTSMNRKLTIEPVKWAVGAGAGGTIGTDNAGHNRMTVYTNDRKYVQYPMTALNRTPVQYDSMYHKTTFYCRLGVDEFRYPETLGYFDGIG